jgi:tetratricopeptide (TPR) repeat protein
MLPYRFIVLSVFCFSVANSQGPSPVSAISPVDFRIAAAQKELQANPKSAAALNDLAFALLRKGRDQCEEASYTEAASALDKSLKVSPANYEAEKLRVAVLLGLNDPANALKLASELNHKVPDDIAVWALLVDANVDLGNYDEAERDAQWVLDLRPGSSLGFEKAAGLRELFGDTEGAIEFLDEANRRTSQNDADQKSWFLTQRARLILGTGNANGASQLLVEALRLFPDSQLAEGVLAQVKIAQGSYPEALSLLEKRYRRVPSPDNLYDWAAALAAAGRPGDAALQFANFEKQARADIAARENPTLQLISYYSDTKLNPAEALSLAATAAAKRQDSPTLAAYAWALYRNGKFSEAKVEMDKALSVGVRNPVYFCHAASISSMAKDTASAERYAKELAGMPAFPCSAGNSLQSANQVMP